MRGIERAAGAAFGDLGMTAIANDEPPSIAELTLFQERARAWVATDTADHPVAYLLVSLVDGNAHVDQVSVHPAHARRGLGRTLLDTVACWARARGVPAIALTTFVDVPWNAPYYERLGFRILREDEIGEGLRQVQEHERSMGLAAWPRATMRRSVDR